MKAIAWIILSLLVVLAAAWLTRLDDRPPAPIQVSAREQPAPPLRRRGIVRIAGHTFVDDDGKYLAVGTTLFPAPWLYRNERARLEENLACLAGRTPDRPGCPKTRVVDYVRVLGAVVGNGGACAPDTNPWGCRATSIEDLLAADLIAQVTDLNYDGYGLRTEWTILGGRIGSAADRETLVRRFVAQFAGRAHKVQHVEVVNERLGFNSPEGVEELKRLGGILRDGLPNLVALTSTTATREDAASLGQGFPLLTVHLDRSQRGVGGKWRPMLQGWTVHFLTSSAWTSNEGIGQNSSVAHDEDPVRLTVYAGMNWLFGAAGHVHHTGSGVYLLEQTHPVGGLRPADLWNVPTFGATIDGIGVLRTILPADLPDFEKHDTAGRSPGYPFDAGPLGTAVTAYEQSGGRRGILRAFAATSDDGRFLVFPIEVIEPQAFTARRAMTFTVHDPITGAARPTVTLAADQTWTLQPTTAALLVGQMR